MGFYFNLEFCAKTIQKRNVNKYQQIIQKAVAAVELGVILQIL